MRKRHVNITMCKRVKDINVLRDTANIIKKDPNRRLKKPYPPSHSPFIPLLCNPMTFLPSPCLVEWQSPHCGGHILVPECTVLSLKIDWWPPDASGLFLLLVRSVSCNYCWNANIHSLVQELVHPHHVNPLRALTKRTRSTQWPKSSGYLLTAINLPFYCSISNAFTGLCCETRRTLRTFFQNGPTPWRANRQLDRAKERDILTLWHRLISPTVRNITVDRGTTIAHLYRGCNAGSWTHMNQEPGWATKGPLLETSFNW